VQCSRCGRTQAAGNLKDNQYECSYCGNFTRHADASDSDHTGITALHAAVQKEGHLDVVVALLEHGADVDCTTAKVSFAFVSAWACMVCTCRACAHMAVGWCCVLLGGLRVCEFLCEKV